MDAGFSQRPGMYYDFYVSWEAMYMLQALMCMLHGITCIRCVCDSVFGLTFQKLSRVYQNK